MVEGEWLLQVINSVNFDDYESLQYFQRVLIQTGVIDALREAGIQEGDTVSIYAVSYTHLSWKRCYRTRSRAMPRRRTRLHRQRS